MHTGVNNTDTDTEYGRAKKFAIFPRLHIQVERNKKNATCHRPPNVCIVTDEKNRG